MSSLIWLLIILALVFGAYAWYTQYNAQPADKSKAARMGGALLAAGASMGALIMSWFSTPTGP